MHMHNRIAHFILSAIDICADSQIDRLVAHCMYMHAQAVFVHSAGNVRNLRFRPVDEALMPVGI